MISLIETLWPLCLQGKTALVVCFIAQRPDSQELATSLILHAEAYCIQADDMLGDLFDMFTLNKVFNDETPESKLAHGRLGRRVGSDKGSLERTLELRWGQKWWQSFGLSDVPFRDILLALRRISRTNTLSQAAMLVAAYLKDNPTAMGKATLPTYKEVADQVIALRLKAAQRDLPTSLLGSGEGEDGCCQAGLAKDVGPAGGRIEDEDDRDEHQVAGRIEDEECQVIGRIEDKDERQDVGRIEDDRPDRHPDGQGTRDDYGEEMAVDQQGTRDDYGDEMAVDQQLARVVPDEREIDEMEMDLENQTREYSRQANPTVVYSRQANPTVAMKHRC
jgi:hypothetical protein